RDAAEVLEDAQTIGAYNGEAYFYLAIAYACTGDDRRAREWMERAFRIRKHWIARAKVDHRLRTHKTITALISSVARSTFASEPRTASTRA
ncbi:MAG: hypothetical protein R3A79_01655, partial [Nannocystaceae bacterium]